MVPIYERGERMPISEAQRRAHKKYYGENWRQLKISMPKEEAERFEAFCEEQRIINQDFTKAGFIRGLIRDAVAEFEASACESIPD